MVKNDVYSKRALNPERLSAIHNYAGGSVLDVGCGNGKYVLELNGRYDIKGTDYQSFDSWKQNPELFSVADIMDLPYETGAFDTVTLFEVLEHIKDPIRALKECSRVARKNIIITVPNCEISDGMRKSLLTYYHYTDETHVNFFTMETLMTTVQQAGLHVKDNRFVNQLNLQPLMQEALGENFLVKSAIKALNKFGSRKYYLTLLINASRE